MRTRALILPAIACLLLAPVSGASLLAQPASTTASPSSAIVSIPNPPAHAGPAYAPLEKTYADRLAPPKAAPPSVLSNQFGWDCGTTSDAGYEWDPTPSQPGSCDGTVGGNDYEDAWAYNLTGPTLLSATVTINGAQKVTLCIYHDYDGGDYYSTLRCDDATPDHAAHTATYVATSGTWHVLLQNTGPATASYHLETTTHGWTTPGDCEGADAPNHESQAELITAPTTCAGSLDPVNDTADWYALHLDAGQAVSVRLAPNPDLDADLCVWTTTNLNRPVDCSILPVGYVDTVLLDNATAQDYLVRVVWFDGAGAYNLTLTPATPQNDCGTGGDVGSRYNATTTTLPASCEASLDAAAGDSWDGYRITLPDRAVRVSLNSDAPITACLYQPGSSWPVRCTSGEAGATHLAYQDPEADTTWILGVFTTGAAHYSISIEPFVPTPQNDCGSGSDAPSWPSTIVNPDVTCTGQLLGSEGDQADAFTIAIPPSTLNASITSSMQSYQACLDTPWGPNSYSEQCYETHNGVLPIDLQIMRGGNVTITIKTAQPDDDFTYALAMAVSAPYSDCGTGQDAPDSTQNAPILSPPVWRCEGKLFMDSGDWTDTYLVHANVGQTITILIEVEEGTLWSACVSSSDGTGLCATGAPLSNVGTATFPATQAGDYSISIMGAGTHNVTYRLSVLVQ